MQKIVDAVFEWLDRISRKKAERLAEEETMARLKRITDLINTDRVDFIDVDPPEIKLKSQNRFDDPNSIETIIRKGWITRDDAIYHADKVFSTPLP